MIQTILYTLGLSWEGRPSDDYSAYGRTYRLRFEGKHEIVGSADQAFMGDPRLHNPEDLFVASVASCHMLTYLALAARKKLGVTGYEDRAEGELELDARGRGRLATIRLRPKVTVARPSHTVGARTLHALAHDHCFVARSCAAQIDIQPTVEIGPCARPDDPDAALRDIGVDLDDAPGALATFGETLGAAGVSLEGGGAWTVDDRGRAHFLVRNADAAVVALRRAGIIGVPRPVLIERLVQGVPGQLGRLTRALADAGVNIEVLYTDHDHRLVLVVDDVARGAEVCRRWRQQAPAAPQ